MEMNWGKFALAVAGAAIAGSFTDWLFFGVIFHNKYMMHPEVWKKREKGEGAQIAFSSVVGLLATAAFLVLCIGLRIDTNSAALKLAFCVWLVGTVPVIVNEHIFMKLHPALFVTHTIGWLVRFELAAVAWMLVAIQKAPVT